MSEQVILRIVLKGGGEMRSVMDESTARRIIQRWKNKGHDDTRFDDHTGWWAVEASEIAAIHYLKVDQVAFSQNQQQSQPPRSPWGVGSG